jgi:hypothetical protein
MTLATVDIVRRTGASGSIVDTAITAGSTRAKTADSAVVDANNPIPIPGAGTNYSYWVTTRLFVAANPDAHTINNLKWYMASGGGLPGGCTMMGQRAGVGADAGYRIATGTPGVTGTLLNTTNHTGLGSAGVQEAPVDVFSYTSAGSRSLAGSTTSTGLVGDHFVFQVGVDSTVTPQSPAPANTFVYRYDEA